MTIMGAKRLVLQSIVLEVDDEHMLERCLFTYSKYVG